MNAPLTKVTLAILYRDGQFLMQLRDDFPHIIHPGIWGFFGGHIDPGEDASTGVMRELHEELGYMPPALSFFQEETGERSHRYYYHGELTVPVSELELNEGQDLALVSVDEIQAGKKYSEKLGEVRALGQHHRQTLLTFLESGLM